MTIDRIAAQRASNAYDYTNTVSTTGAKSSQEVGALSANSPQPTGNEGVAPDAKVTLSPDAQTFAKALQSAQQQSDVRPDRVADVRSRLAEIQARLEVDTSTLAAKMLGIKS